MRIFGQCLLSKGREDEAEAAKASAAEPEGASGKTDTANVEPDDGKETLSTDEKPQAAEPQGASGETDTANAEADGGKETLSTDEKPQAASGETDTTNAEADGGKETLSATQQPQQKTADQTDDLLFPTEDERRAIEASIKQPRKQLSLKERPATPRRAQIRRWLTFKQGLRP